MLSACHLEISGCLMITSTGCCMLHDDTTRIHQLNSNGCVSAAAASAFRQDCEDFLGRGSDLQRLLQQLGAPRGGLWWAAGDATPLIPSTKGWGVPPGDGRRNHRFYAMNGW